MLATSATYRTITKDLERSLALKSVEKPVALESAYYLKNINNIKSIDDFLKDTRLFNTAMTAFGLADMAYAKAYMRKVLSEGVEDKDSFANRIDDQRFIQFAQTFNFTRDGAAATETNDARQGVVDRYVRQVLEVDAGQTNEGVRLALYFLREAPTVTSAYDLLADPALWQVVKTVFGFPDEMANADIEKQAAAVLERLDLADLDDPVALDRLLTQFTVVWDATEVATQDPILSLFNPASSSATVDLDLVITLNNLKHGGL